MDLDGYSGNFVDTFLSLQFLDTSSLDILAVTTNYHWHLHCMVNYV